ncbi:MAG: helix-turn-helix transcriptional regulator [Gemmatimonadota bacterium]|nr:MAG: helix-turn-helix transcriptional regulator [Gemmatimonadota bacterium]
MAIKVNLDLLLVQRKTSLTQLAEEVGITLSYMSLLKAGKVRGIRFNGLNAICRTLDCKPGDILDYEPDAGDAEATER